MTAFDDEVSALLALDALEGEEQADAELRLGTFPPALMDTSAALAERTVAEPPPDLRAAALARATDRRRAGRPVDGAAACEPDDAFARTVADLHELLLSLTPSEWHAHAHSQHGRVRDLVAHLIAVEELSARWLDPDDDVPALPDHIAATRPIMDELADVAPADLARRWHDAARAVASAAAAGDPARPVTFHDLTLSVSGLLVTRTFELWAHAMDIAAATGRPLLRLDPERMVTMSTRLMGAVPMALAYRGRSVPGRTARFVLTGTAGGCYTVPLHPGDDLGEPDVTVVVGAVELCRLAARRIGPDELAVSIDGDRELGELVLAGIDAFARD